MKTKEDGKKITYQVGTQHYDDGLTARASLKPPTVDFITWTCLCYQNNRELIADRLPHSTGESLRILHFLATTIAEIHPSSQRGKSTAFDIQI